MDSYTEAEMLTEEEAQILGLERQWWKYAGAKDQAISEQLSMSAVSYYRTLNRLIDTEDALAYDPILVKRLRRQREARHRERSAKR